MCGDVHSNIILSIQVNDTDTSDSDEEVAKRNKLKLVLGHGEEWCPMAKTYNREESMQKHYYNTGDDGVKNNKNRYEEVNYKILNWDPKYFPDEEYEFYNLKCGDCQEFIRDLAKASTEKSMVVKVCKNSYQHDEEPCMHCLCPSCFEVGAKVCGCGGRARTTKRKFGF